VPVKSGYRVRSRKRAPPIPAVIGTGARNTPDWIPRIAARASAATIALDWLNPAKTSISPFELPTKIWANPDVAPLAKNASKRPCGVPLQALPLHVTVIAPTLDGRPESVDAEKPAPTSGAFDADAVNVGLPAFEIVALKPAVRLVKFAFSVPVIDGAPVAPENVLADRLVSIVVKT